MTLGGINHDLYQPPIFYTPMYNQEYTVNLLDLKMNETSLGFNSSIFRQQGYPLVDSGTFSLVIPTPVFNKISQLLNESCPESHLAGVCGLKYEDSLFNGVCFQMNAHEIFHFPKFDLVLEGEGKSQSFSLPMPPSNYLIQDYFDNTKYCYGIQNGGSPTWTILGDTVLKDYYSIFDLQNQQIGFARANGKNCRQQHH